jgi:acyl-CoA hydrolase
VRVLDEHTGAFPNHDGGGMYLSAGNVLIAPDARMRFIDFARGAVFAEHGRSFVVLRFTTADEPTSRVVAQLHPGAAVTTLGSIVDCAVTEYGVVELRGSSLRERIRRLVGIARQKFRDGS